MMKRIIIILAIIAIVGCDRHDEESLARRTVIVYMAADNDLFENAGMDINEMLVGDVPSDCNLAVYLDPPSQSSYRTPKLYRVSGGALQPVKEYESHNSASGATMRQVLDDAVNIFAAESYGLVLWSHGSGWLPQGGLSTLERQGRPAAYSAVVKSFANDNGAELEIRDLADALPLKFDFVLFDACFMGSIEVCYQLRNKAEIVIASPAEILVTGFPYDNIIAPMFAATPDCRQIATEYINYYDRQLGLYRSATVSVVNTAELEPLAQLVSRLTLPDIDNRTGIQRYDVFKPAVFYDFMDCVRNTALASADLDAIEQQLQKAVIYSAHTPCFLDIQINSSCGVSIYLPSDARFDECYRQLDWGRIME